VIIKGGSVRGGARRLAAHLMRADTNERVEIRELRGVAARDLRGALLDIEAVGVGVTGERIFYHASINPEQPISAEQWARAIDRLEQELGLTDQPRVVVAHCKDGRDHCHIVWSRIDLDRMALIPDNHNFRKHEIVARELEREFGHQKVQGAHIDRDGKERPERTLSHAEMLQADRTGVSAREVKEQITQLWQSTETGKDFANALEQNGFVLARGDRRDFVVIDRNGGTHSLVRRIEGATAKDLRKRMADIDSGRLPSVAEAKDIQQDRARGLMPVRDQLDWEDKLREAGTTKLDFEDSALATFRQQEDEKKRHSDSLNWTNHGGMVEQQHSALMWAKKAEDQRTERGEQTDRKQERTEAQQIADQRKQDYLRAFGREAESEEELDRGRERSPGGE
jgi:Relaxase/Mobilisation nuclease domain